MVRTIARALAQSGIETHIATTDDNGPTRLDVPCGGPTIEDGVTYWYFRRQSRFYKFSWPLTTWLARNIGTFDIVHIHALFSYAAAPAAFCAQRSHVPYLVRPLGTLNRWGMMHRRPGLKQVSFRLIETPILRDASTLCTPSTTFIVALSTTTGGRRSSTSANASTWSSSTLVTLGE